MTTPSCDCWKIKNSFAFVTQFCVKITFNSLVRSCASQKCEGPMSQFFQNFSQASWAASQTGPVSFYSDQPALTLSDSCSKFIGQWQTCILRYLSSWTIMAVQTKTLHANFQINRTNSELAIFMFFSRCSATMLLHPFSHNHRLSTCADFGEISFTSYSHFSKGGSALVECSGGPYGLFLIIIDNQLQRLQAKNPGLVRKSSFLFFF